MQDFAFVLSEFHDILIGPFSNFQVPLTYRLSSLYVLTLIQKYCGHDVEKHAKVKINVIQCFHLVHLSSDLLL